MKLRSLLCSSAILAATVWGASCTHAQPVPAQWNYSFNAQGVAQATYPGAVVAASQSFNQLSMTPPNAQPAITITAAETGPATLLSMQSILTTGDSSFCAFCTDINVTHNYGGATTRGARVAYFGWEIQNSAQSGTGTTVAVGTSGIGQDNSGDGGTGLTNGTAQGTYFGGNLIGRNSGTNVQEVVGGEFDTETQIGSSARYSFGQSIVNYEAVQGAFTSGGLDAGLVFYTGGTIPAAGGGGPWGPGIGWHCGICFAELSANGLAPIDSGATVFGTHLESLTSFPAAIGIDLRGFTFSQVCAICTTTWYNSTLTASDNIFAAAGNFRTTNYQTGATIAAALNRFSIGLDASAEGGGAGSNFGIFRYNDAGGFVDTPISINRQFGTIALQDFTTNTKGIEALGSTPTLSGTCTTNTQVGGQTAGTFKATCTAQTVIITFATGAANGWSCLAQDETTSGDTLKQTAHSTTSCTLTGTTVAADVIVFQATAF